MPSMYDMSEDDDLFRGFIEYDLQQYNPLTRKHEGPLQTHTMVVGPYKNVGPIKRKITDMRKHGYYKNPRLVKVEKVSAWEKVEIV